MKKSSIVDRFRASPSFVGVVLTGSLISVAPSLVGCGAGDPFARIDASFERMVNDVCSRCPAAFGYANEAECRRAAMEENPLQDRSWSCQRGVYQRFPNELGPYYDCVARAFADYERCMRDAVAICSSSMTAIRACGERLQPAIEACPQPDSIMAREALSMCF